MLAVIELLDDSLIEIEIVEEDVAALEAVLEALVTEIVLETLLVMGRDTLSVTYIVSVCNKDGDSVTVPVAVSTTEWVVEDDLLSVWVLVAVGGTLLEVVVVRDVVVGTDAVVVSVWD